MVHDWQSVCPELTRIKILVVSNFFPPYFVGGYELGCADVVDGLGRRDNKIAVLTGMYGVNRAVVEGPVHRLMDIRWTWPTGIKGVLAILQRERRNQQAFRKLVKEFSPDVVYFWHVGFGCTSLVHDACRMGLPSVCFVSDSWFSEIESLDGLSRLLNDQSPSLGRRAVRFLMTSALRALNCTLPQGTPNLSLVQFCSRYLRDNSSQAIDAVNTKTVVRHWGVKASHFSPGNIAWPPQKLLYAGRISPEKGLHTALDAFIEMQQQGHRELTFTIVGEAIDQSYMNRLRSKIEASGCPEHFLLLGKVPRAEMVSVYASHDILIFPSEWPEPFSIALLEAMASGMAIVGTTTGGTGEILVDSQTGVTFEAGNAEACRSAIVRLLDAEQLYRQVRKQARQAVTAEYDLESMIDSINQDLFEICH